MDTDLSNGGAEAPEKPHAAPDERASEFGRRTPAEIGVHLRNLASRRDNLTVQYAGGQLVTQLLDVDLRRRVFTFDWGSQPEQNQGLLAARRCLFQAQPEGVRIEFSIGTPREVRYEGMPAFEADFPEVLVYMQRREYFRTRVTGKPLMCNLPPAERSRPGTLRTPRRDSRRSVPASAPGSDATAIPARRPC